MPPARTSRRVPTTAQVDDALPGNASSTLAWLFNPTSRAVVGYGADGEVPRPASCRPARVEADPDAPFGRGITEWFGPVAVADSERATGAVALSAPPPPPPWAAEVQAPSAM